MHRMPLRERHVDHDGRAQEEDHQHHLDFHDQHLVDEGPDDEHLLELQLEQLELHYVLDLVHDDLEHVVADVFFHLEHVDLDLAPDDHVSDDDDHPRTALRSPESVE